MDDGLNVNRNYRTKKSNQFFLVRHSQSSSIPDCPMGTSALWSGYSLYSFSFDDNVITRDLGTVDSCIQVTNEAYFSYCSGSSNCNTISTVAWLSNRNTSISRCSVCLVSSSPITLHSQSTNPPACPSNWSSLWVGYSHIQVSEFVRIQHVILLWFLECRGQTKGRLVINWVLSGVFLTYSSGEVPTGWIM